jgi:hypothetical protein
VCKEKVCSYLPLCSGSSHRIRSVSVDSPQCCTRYTTGLADRLLGTVSAFYYALLTRRALQLQTYGGVPSLEVGSMRGLKAHHFHQPDCRCVLPAAAIIVYGIRA